MTVTSPIFLVKSQSKTSSRI